MKGILFTPDSRKAIREGRKTITRRVESILKVINQEPDKWEYKRTIIDGRVLFWLKSEFASEILEDPNNIRLVKPRYQVGEILYIKEAHRYIQGDGIKGDFAVEYKDGETRWWFDHAGWFEYPIKSVWRSPLFMPAWAARDFIKILDRRAERLQEITDKEAIAEGISCLNESPRITFAYYWNSINPKYPWESNPWVFRYDFEVVEK